MSEQQPSTFQRHLRHIPPLTPDTLHIVIDGYVHQSLTLDYNTLRSYPAITTQAFLMCAGHTPAEPLVSVVRWTGVPLHELLGQVRPDDHARYLNVHSADGYATSLPISVARETLLAYAMNDEPLPPGHGFPARLVIPARYGYKQPKWVQHLILSDTPVVGHWEQRGRDQAGVTAPIATVDRTKMVARAGVLVPLGGLTNAEIVEISVDGGPWNPAMVRDDLTWSANWTPTQAGVYRLRIRAQREAELQPEATQPVITVEVSA